MVVGSANAAVAAMWISRRSARVASQQIYHHDQQSVPAVQAPWNKHPTILGCRPPLPWTAHRFPSPVTEPITSITSSISKKIREKFSTNESQMEQLLSELNKDVFWSKYASLNELSRIDRKDDIMKIIRTFLFISKKSIYLFSNFSRKIIANINDYSANDLGEIINAFAQLGFLEESFCVQIADRVSADLKNCSPHNLVLILDGFASTRCSVENTIINLCDAVDREIDNLSVPELSLLASSLARLNVHDEKIYEKISKKFIQISIELPMETQEVQAVVMTPPCSARDVTLAAYAFAKIYPTKTDEKFQQKIVSLSKILIRDFTAKELQMLSTALDRWTVGDVEMFSQISQQAQRRIAQFSSETLIHFLRVFASRSVYDEVLISRVICQLPRISQTFKPSEIVSFWSIFRDLKIKSTAGIEILRPLTVTRAGTFSVNDWMTIMNACAMIGYESANQEIVDAFVMINELPAKFKGTLTPVYSTILERLTPAQTVTLLQSISQMELASKNQIVELVSKTINVDSISASDASDMYCSLVALSCHENETMNHLMTRLMCKAIQV